MISRKTAVLSAAGAALVFTSGGALAASLDKSVNLSVDGASSSHHVFARTVGDLLSAQGIAVSGADVVVPDPSAPLHDGDTVTVKYARTVTVTIDGKTRTITTTETNVDGALLALGLHGGDDRLSVSRSQTIGRQGLSLTVTTPKDITVVVAGKPAKHTITAATVSEALAQLRVQVGPADKVAPAPAAALADGTTIVVQHVTTKDAAVAQAIPFTTVRKQSADLYAGETKVATPGATGSRTVTVRQTVVDGKVVSSTAVAATVTRPAVNQVVLVGTRQRPAPTPAPVRTSSSRTTSPAPAPTNGGGLNLARASMWDRVASCESGNNWHINTGNGYYGGLQFSVSTWLGYGGGQFAPRADLATREQQITVANRAYADNGLSQWSCKA
ncbi:MAG TPA: transglycosylase family protein [Intrasporangium sp.]|uniref:transglycosylase family protein n=1 Tax=Intrasporangium sp. TaxID=1925024 RepID=UPI002D7894D2|nr:transglycosylase family protein [Intrasporangium sp.]HET7399789.1 transglycosylase family protein [Intrasporangium sp.]